MPYNPQEHHRRSIRLKGYDYRQPGLYFLTLYCHKGQCLFGHIKDGEMILNPAGKIAHDCWQAIPNHFPHAALHAFIIMPNHMHGIIEIVRANNHSPPNARANNHSPLPQSPSKTIGSIVRGYKIGVTKWMRKNTDTYHVWLRNYYDIIISSEQAYKNITRYIQNNPANWEKCKGEYRRGE